MYEMANLPKNTNIMTCTVISQFNSLVLCRFTSIEISGPKGRGRMRAASE